MSDPKWCSHCGAQHTGALALCEKCLAAGAAPAAPSAPEPPKAAPAASEKKPVNVALAMGGAVAVVMVAAVVYLLVAGPKAPVPAAGTQAKAAPVADPFEPAEPGEPTPFREEPAPPGLPAGGIAGEYWRETEPPGRPRKMSLCPDGTYFEYSSRVGRWTSTGNDEGKVAIAMENGRAVELDYRILREPRFCSKAGCDAEFAGARYGRDPTLGNCR
ncbi:MAG: hypothetical protein ACYC8T_06480 [Myxococcaceae bacterium]